MIVSPAIISDRAGAGRVSVATADAQTKNTKRQRPKRVRRTSGKRTRRTRPQRRARRSRRINRTRRYRRSSRTRYSASNRKRRKRVRKRKVCKRVRGKRRCRWVPYFKGHGVAKSKLRKTPVPKPSGNVWLYVTNLREEIRVNLYNEDGTFNDEALAQLDHGFRDRRNNEVRAVSPELYEVLSTICDHFGKRVSLISGFRDQDNDGSRHFHGSAMDIKIDDTSIQELYQFAQSLDRGNMGIGIYPTSGFVHIDFRAPEAPSYYWVDYSGPKRKRKRKPRRSKRRRRSS